MNAVYCSAQVVFSFVGQQLHTYGMTSNFPSSCTRCKSWGTSRFHWAKVVSSTKQKQQHSSFDGCDAPEQQAGVPFSAGCPLKGSHASLLFCRPTVTLVICSPSVPQPCQSSSSKNPVFGMSAVQRQAQHPLAKQILKSKNGRRRGSKSIKVPFLMVKFAGVEKVAKAIMGAWFTGVCWRFIDGDIKSRPKIKLCFWAFHTQRQLFQVKKMLTKENRDIYCLIFYQHKMCSIVLIEAMCS